MAGNGLSKLIFQNGNATKLNQTFKAYMFTKITIMAYFASRNGSRGWPSIVVLTKSDPSARGYASYQEPCHTMRDQPSPLERDRESKLVNRAWETFPNGSVD